jgi:CRISPR-associated protein Csb2
LDSICSKVTSVGHPASLVQAWVDRTRPVSRWFPRDELVPEHRLRVTFSGRLADLERSYNKAAVDEFTGIERELQTAKGKRKAELKAMKQDRFSNVPPVSLRPVPRSWKGYVSAVQPVPKIKPACSLFDSNLLILRSLAGPRLGLESTLQLTAAVRDTVMSRCVQPPPEWVSGHTADGAPSQKPHLAFLPLPHVGREHAEGHLLGIAIAVPCDVPSAEQQRCLGKLLWDERGECRELEIRMGKIGVWKVVLDEDADSRAAMQNETWAADQKGAVRWATVTPIVLDRHPKQPGQAEETIAVACQRVGLPRPADVVLASVSMFIGAPHARRFPNMQRKTGGNLHHTHAILTFDQPVIGPVLLGAGRYRGYGLCRPLLEGGRAWTS